MSGGGGGDTTTIQDIPKEFKPAYLTLFNSAFAAARVAAGQYSQDRSDPYASDSAAIYGDESPVVTPASLGGPRAGSGMVTSDGRRNAPRNDDRGFFGLDTTTTGKSQDGSDEIGMTQMPDGTYRFDEASGPSWPAPEGERPQGGIEAGPYGGIYSNEMGSLGFGRLPAMLGPNIVGQPFPGPFNAAPHPFERQALIERGRLSRDLQGIDIPALELGLDTTTGEYLDPESNPYLASSIELAQRPIRQRLVEQSLPQVASEAINAGAFKGSSRRGLIESQLIRDAGQQENDVATQLLAENYGRERQNQMMGPALLDQAIRLGQIPSELLGQTGAGLRNIEQAGIEEDLRQFEEGIQAPFRPLLPLAGLVRGQNIGSNTTTSRPTSSFQSGILGALGGGAAGGAVGSAFGNTGGGAAVGAGLGALAGFLG